MKKTIVALSTLALTTGAFAATNTSTTTAKTSKSSILDNMSAAYLISATKETITDKNTTPDASLYHILYLNYKVNNDVSLTTEVRFNQDEAENSNGDGYAIETLAPRFKVYAFRQSIETSFGKIVISPSLRYQPPVSGDSNENFGYLKTSETINGKFRLAANTGISMGDHYASVFSAVYKTWTKDLSEAEAIKAGTTKYKHDRSASKLSFYVNPYYSYSLNDNHSLSATFEHYTSMDINNEGAETSSNTLYLTYANSSIKNLSISPSLYRSISEEDNKNISLDTTTLAIDGYYSF